MLNSIKSTPKTYFSRHLPNFIIGPFKQSVKHLSIINISSDSISNYKYILKDNKSRNINDFITIGKYSFTIVCKIKEGYGLI